MGRETRIVSRLVQRTRDGDRGAFEELYHLYVGALYNTAFRILDCESDAEDVVHDVFVGLPTALRTYRERGTFGGWLKQIATRVALMKLRRRNVRAETSMQDVEPLPTRVDGSLTIDAVSLRDAVGRLPQDLRVVLVLKDIEGYSHAEIAKLVDISVAASRTRLFRARETLRHQLAISPDHEPARA